IAPEPPARISISPRELVRAVTIGRSSLIDLCLIEQVDPNGRDTHGRTPLLIATSRQDWKTARRLIDAGALVDHDDEKGFATLMARNKDQIRLLLGKHATPPTPEGKRVPLVAYAIAKNDAPLFSTLMACGADPNTVLPTRCDKEFLALLPSKSLRSYIEEDRNVTVLMLAAGLGQEGYVRALLGAGADRTRATRHDKMLALYIAAETGQWRCTQILLGGGPSPDELRIEISLASQRVALIKNGVPMFRTECST